METQALQVDRGESLGEIASRIPAASRVFREAGLDYCCGGKRTLEEVCSEKGLDLQKLIDEIRTQAPAPAPSWERRPLAALVTHILERYHEPLRRELPELHRMAVTVEEKHRENPLCPSGLAAHTAAIHEAVLSHLDKEERILFPMILAGRGPYVSGPVQVMEMEHEEHGANLARTRSLTHDFALPADACPTWRALYLRLQELEADLMDHIHLENNILFPRALCE
jgi:regulator of cell morphogenesis and NO signaling